MTLLPPEYRGGEDPYGHRSWRERNGGRLLAALSVAGALVFAAVFVISRENNDSTPPAATTTTQPDTFPAPTPSTTTTEAKATTTGITAETTTTLKPQVAKCVANLDLPAYETDREIILQSAHRAYFEQYHREPEDPAQFTMSALIDHCTYWVKMGGRNP